MKLQHNSLQQQNNVEFVPDFTHTTTLVHFSISPSSFSSSSSFKVLYNKKKFNNPIIEIHKDSIMWCLLKHKITCHSPPCTICQKSAATVARTSQESQACLNTCSWSMEPPVFAICYIMFKIRTSLKEHMKKGAHLLFLT